MPITNDDELRRIISEARTIAVIGASNTPGKPAHEIPRYLQALGYTVIPVNPAAAEILGVPTVASLDAVTAKVDIVDVFRPAEVTPPIAEAAVRIGAKVLWLQAGIVSEEAARIAEAGGLQVVMDTCLGAKHESLHIPSLNGATPTLQH